VRVTRQPYTVIYRTRRDERFSRLFAEGRYVAEAFAFAIARVAARTPAEPRDIYAAERAQACIT